MMTLKRQAVNLLFPVARAMLTATFIISAVRHLTHWTAGLNEMASSGIPRSSVLLFGSVALRLVGGLMVLFGLAARWGAAMLLAFVLPAALLAHDFWAMPATRQPHETINNLAIAAGALLVVLNGSGAFSVDQLRSGSGFPKAQIVAASLEAA